MLPLFTKCCCVLIGLVSMACQILALNNGLAVTPPMGWINWERYRCEIDCKTYPDSCINEQLFMRQADMIVKLGLKDVGFEYVNIDDCWLSKERDPNTGELVPDPDRFPSGIPALVDYMHQRGLKLGIYEDFGVRTCGEYPGSEFYLDTDAKTFAKWNVDMLKFDGCNSDPSDFDYGYPAMEFFMNKTGHPILFSCEWPVYQKGNSNYTAIRETCNMWRSGGDVQDSWDSVNSIISQYGSDQYNISQFSGPGSWADPDMLIVGDFGLSYDQQKAQMGMWAMFSAPLFMSVDLTSISQQSLDILLNKRVIDIDQDPLGVMAKQTYVYGNTLTGWFKPLSGGKSAIAVLCQHTEGRPIALNRTLSDWGLNNNNGYNLTEVFDNTYLGMYKPASYLNVIVNPSGIILIRADPL